MIWNGSANREPVGEFRLEGLIIWLISLPDPMSCLLIVYTVAISDLLVFFSSNLDPPADLNSFSKF
jgi:hypothetical protein